MMLATGLLMAALSGVSGALACDEDGPDGKEFPHQFLAGAGTGPRGIYLFGAGTGPRGIYLFVATNDRCEGEGRPSFEPTMDCRLYLVPFGTGKLGGTGTRRDPSRIWLPTRGAGLVVEAWSSPAFWRSMDDLRRGVGAGSDPPPAE